MYGWLWRKLPGRAAGKTTCLVLIIAAVGAALWFGLFPWVQLHVPIDGSTITG